MAAAIQNRENSDTFLNSNLQLNSINQLLNASKTVLTSTITNLIDENLSSGKMGDNLVSDDTSESNNTLGVEKSISLSVLNGNPEDALTPSPSNYTTIYDGPTVCVNGTGIPVAPAPTNLSEIPAKEVIIVVLMLSLWLYAIHMTRRAWQRLLKE